MRTFALLKNERGFTLANIAVGLAIGSIVILGMAAALSMTFSAQRNLDAKASAAIFTDELAHVMAGTATCARALDTATGSVTLNATAVDVQLIRPGGLAVAAGSLVAKNLQVEQLQIREDTSVPDQPGPGGVGYRRRAAILSVKFKNLSDNAQPLQIREIPFRTVTNSTKQIVSCSIDSNEVQACEAGGGTWDPASLDAQKCRPPNQSCQYGGSFSEAPVGGYKNPFTGTNGCQPGFNQQQTGQISNVVTTSKETFTTTHYPVFTCMRCWVDLAPSTATTSASTMTFTALVNDALASGTLQDGINLNGFNFFGGFF